MSTVGRCIKLSIAALFLAAAFTFVAPKKAEAACFFPHEIVTTYWEDVSISPHPTYLPEVIGQCERDCSGNVTCWGYQQSQKAGWTTSTTFQSSACPPICP